MDNVITNATPLTTLESKENETIQQLMARMIETCNATRSIMGYASVRSAFKGLAIEAYGIQQGRNRHDAMQIRWYINGKVTSKAKVAAL